MYFTIRSTNIQIILCGISLCIRSTNIQIILCGISLCIQSTNIQIILCGISLFTGSVKCSNHFCGICLFIGSTDVQIILCSLQAIQNVLPNGWLTLRKMTLTSCKVSFVIVFLPPALTCLLYTSPSPRDFG